MTRRTVRSAAGARGRAAPAETATCATCPAWCQITNDDGSDQVLPRLGADGQPVVVNGQRELLRDEAGGFVLLGSCRARAPAAFLAPNGATVGSFPTARSDWWCGEHPQRRRG
jgi:hypothetical protein